MISLDLHPWSVASNISFDCVGTADVRLIISTAVAVAAAAAAVAAKKDLLGNKCKLFLLTSLFTHPKRVISSG